MKMITVLTPLIRFHSNILAYGYGVLSVVIITLLSLLGIVALPLMNKPFVNYLLEMFVALGVSTLFSDALLHLLPMVSLLNVTRSPQLHVRLILACIFISRRSVCTPTPRKESRPSLRLPRFRLLLPSVCIHSPLE